MIHVLPKICPSPGFQNSFLSSSCLIGCFSSVSLALVFSIFVHPTGFNVSIFSLPRWTHFSRTSPELGSLISNCLFDISIWMCNRLPQCSVSKLEFFKKIFFNVYLFLREKERERMGEGQRERETQNLKQAPDSELSAQSPVWGSSPTQGRTVRS